MSLLKTNQITIGNSQVESENFTIRQPATPDGTLRISRGNVGSLDDVLIISETGILTVPGGIANLPKLEGSSYVFVAGDGTASQNGAALLSAYEEAKSMTPYGNSLSNTNRAWVIVAPGTYDETLVMDEEFVNVVSLDGDMSIRLTGIDVQANNVLVRGIDVGSATFLIGTDLDGLVAEKCKGGFESFGGDGFFENLIDVSGRFVDCVGGAVSFGGGNTASGTFINCTGTTQHCFGSFSASGTFIDCTVPDPANEAFGANSFGNFGASGIFTNCKAGQNSFSGIASGTFTNCTAFEQSFGSSQASGTFTNCRVLQSQFGNGGEAFGSSSGATVSGTFKDCTSGYASFGGFGADVSGTFENCKAGDFSFGVISGSSSGTFENCKAGDFSFGGSGGTASGKFTNCTGGDSSFGNAGTASGTFTNCTAGGVSFGLGSGGTLTGNVLYCRLTSGTFQTPSSDGLIRLSLDGTFTETNLG